WGRVQRTVQASQAQAQATLIDLAVVSQTVAADVAVNYFNLRLLDAQDQIFRRNIDLYRDQLKLSQTQFDAGLVGPTDILQVQTLLEATQAQAIDLRRQRADLEHALAILLGQPPAEFTLKPRPPDAKEGQMETVTGGGGGLVVPPGLPADLLRRRPDVAEAEQNLVAANAQIGIAKANYYPVVQLTGVAGFESIDMQHVVDWQSRIWSLGPSVSVPIFEGGKLDANLQQAKARYEELTAIYRGSVLKAFGEVEDSLTDLHLRSDAAVAQARAVKAAREYLRLARLQYQQGLVNNLVVIDADRTLLTNELAALQIQSQRLVSTVLLFKALGGGWDAQNPAPTPAGTSAGTQGNVAP
ncbi:MAG: efflux transporter outer membrane subunit, partial [Phycisphaerae bacterium]